MTSSRGKKTEGNPKKRQKPSRAEGKKQFVFNHSSDAEHECFCFSVRLEVVVNLSYPLFCANKITYLVGG